MASSEASRANALDIVRELRHRTCIGAVAQPETGADLLLHFGTWQNYETPPNPNLRVVERGQWSLMVSCPWRLDGPQGVVCDWRGVSDAERESEELHVVFEGLRVEDINLKTQANDLLVEFSDGYTLRVLCDSAGKGDDCWYLLRPDSSSLGATRDYRLLIEAADKDA